MTSGSYVRICEATVTGAVIVQDGGRLDVEQSSIGGSISSSHATGVRICDSQTSGGVSVTASTGPVTIGDPSTFCLPNTIGGSLIVQYNTGGTAVSGNHVTGTTLISHNV